MGVTVSLINKYEELFVIEMAWTRTSIVLDEILARKVRQLFGGNLSKGINALLSEHFAEQSEKGGFGSLKGKISAKDIVEDDSDEPYPSR